MTSVVSSRIPTYRRYAAAFVAAVMLVGVILSGSAGQAHASQEAASQSSQLESLEKSILRVGVVWRAQVLVPFNDGTSEWQKVEAGSLCTGWFASTSGDIVTAGHCLDPKAGKIAILRKYLNSLKTPRPELLENAKANWRVEGAMAGSDPDRLVQVVQSDNIDGAVITTAVNVQVVVVRPEEQGDIALLRLASTAKTTPALVVADKKPGIGAEATAIGYPSSVDENVDRETLRPSFKSGRVSSSQVRNGVSGIELDAQLDQGMSGGPTVGPDGRVYGVNSFIATNSAGVSFITGTEDLRSFLSANNVRLAAAAPEAPAGGGLSPSTLPLAAEEESEGGVPLWLIFVLGGVVLAMLVIGTIFFVRFRQKETAAPSQQTGSFPALKAPPCPHCGHAENLATAKFCSGCGQAQPQPTASFHQAGPWVQ